MSLKFLVIGLGSMGKRRIRNLFANSEKGIVGFDPREDRRREAEEKYGIKIIDDFKKVSVKDFDALIISSPPDSHGQYIRSALSHKKHFFVEHPTSDDGYKEIFKNRHLNIVKAPSCTFRFYAPIKIIKKILDENRIGKILAFQYHMGQYLPDWHPWEDYRQVYFSKKETGACREMLPFELIWLNWLISSTPSDVSGIITKISDLDMDADDILLANLKYKNGVCGNILIDVISRKPYRTLRVLGSDGVLDWERFDSTIKLYNVESKSTETIPVPKGNPEKGYVNEEEMYINEIKAFLDAIYGRQDYPFSFKENLLNLKTLFALEEVWKQKKDSFLSP
ncbi:MAG: 3-chlorobenzoate-3,4-dioxygenase [Parcubacteria group bacterium]|nr:3-chlorobenzoate-3,4-dioxygenase [Parcubacteria group bacterium]|tara:strand:- start:14340 stop:15350 length:1011 start_codon:yes stop_codon:yes gene_type:complete